MKQTPHLLPTHVLHVHVDSTPQPSTAVEAVVISLARIERENVHVVCSTVSP